jgi:hypothetical protein
VRISEGYPITPHAIFEGFRGFLGSGRFNFGPISMFRASNESLFCLQFNPSKNNNFKVPPIDRVLDSLNLDPEGLGGMME